MVIWNQWNSSNRTKLDDLSPWNEGKSFNNNGMESVNDEERSIALSK